MQKNWLDRQYLLNHSISYLVFISFAIITTFQIVLVFHTDIPYKFGAYKCHCKKTTSLHV